MKKLIELTKESLSETEIEVLDVHLFSSGLLKVVINHPKGVTTKVCEDTARQLNRVFQVEGLDYKDIEVSSPGIDRQLLSESDFLRVLGHRVRIKFCKAVNGQKEFCGLLQKNEFFLNDRENNLEDKNIRLEFALQFSKNNTNQVIKFTIDEIANAKLDPILDFKVKNR